MSTPPVVRFPLQLFRISTRIPLEMGKTTQKCCQLYETSGFAVDDYRNEKKLCQIVLQPI